MMPSVSTFETQFYACFKMNDILAEKIQKNIQDHTFRQTVLLLQIFQHV